MASSSGSANRELLKYFTIMQGRKWYARIPVSVKVNNKPKGKMKAGIDLGIVNLATVAVQDGSWMIFKGGSVLSEFKKLSKRIAKEKKKLAKHWLEN